MTTFFCCEQRAWGDGVSQYLQYCLICRSCQSDLHQCAPIHTHTHTQTYLSHCQSKLGACSLNPIYGSPVVFLDAVSDMGKKGRKSSTYHSGREEKNICIWSWERQSWTDWTKKMERLKQTGRHQRESERGREKERQTHRQTEGYPSSPPQLPVTHSWWQPPSCVCLRHLIHTRTWYCHHTMSTISNQYTAECVCIYLCVSDWVCDPLLGERM